MRARSCLALLFLGLACPRPTPREDPAPASIPAPPSPEREAPASGPAETPPAPRPAGLPPDKAAYCDTSADCAWNDPCAPTRCVGSAQTQHLAPCDDALTPPGECFCLQHACTLKPSRTPDPLPAPCETDAQCQEDRSAALCYFVPAEKDGLKSPLSPQGPLCQCLAAQSSCAFSWSPPVACTSDKDCSWEYNPLRPVPSSKTPRPVKGRVKPCKNSEVDSVCEPSSHTCTIVSWRC